MEKLTIDGKLNEVCGVFGSSLVKYMDIQGNRLKEIKEDEKKEKEQLVRHDRIYGESKSIQ